MTTLARSNASVMISAGLRQMGRLSLKRTFTMGTAPIAGSFYGTGWSSAKKLPLMVVVEVNSSVL